MAEENKTTKTETHPSDAKVEAEIKEEIKEKIEEKKKEHPAGKKEEKAWKEFIIPLRRKFKKTARYRRAPKSIKAIKEFLVRHMKMYERDLRKVRLDKYLNEFVWTRGIKNPPSRIKIKAVIEGGVIRAELAELTEKLRFRKEKLERRESEAAAVPSKKAPEQEKVETKTEDEKAEEKEKKASVVEAGQKMEKVEAKRMKHESKVSKQPKHQRRMALQK